MSLRMNPTPLGAIDYNTPNSSSSSNMTTYDVDADLAHDEETLSDLQPAVSAAPGDDVSIVAEVRDEPQCEITVVEPDRPHNPAHVVQEPAAAVAGRVTRQRRIRDQAPSAVATGNESADQGTELRGTRQIRRPRRFLDCVVPYFCRKSQ